MQWMRRFTERPLLVTTTTTTCQLCTSPSSLLQSNLLLASLSNSGKIEKARQVFDKLPSRDHYTWNTMISAYSLSGRLQEATLLFKASPFKTTVTWSSLISGHSRHGHHLRAISLFWEMQSHGHKPNPHSLGAALSACSSSPSLLPKGLQLHAHSLKHFPLHSTPSLLTSLLTMYSKCRLLPHAHLLFSSTHPLSRSQVLWTAMISALSLNGALSQAIQTFISMLSYSFQANDFVLPVLLSTCARIPSLPLGLQLHSLVSKQGFLQNAFVNSALVHMYAKCASLDSSRALLLENKEFHDAVAWNSLIVAYGRSGCSSRAAALSLLREMLTRIQMDDFTYPTLLNILSSSSSSSSSAVESIHCSILKNGHHCNLYVGNSLVHAYSQLGRINNAVSIFDAMKTKDTISWTSLLTGYSRSNLHEEAIKLFLRMRGFEPDHFAYAGVLSACAHLALLTFGQQVHADFIKSMLPNSTSLDNSLISMYSRCGCVEEAALVFQSMDSHDVISWTSVIMGHAQNGRGVEAVNLYEEMVAGGTPPDYVAFIGLLFACSHAGLVSRGRKYFEDMERVYGVKPGMDHYTCMVDLFARSGEMEEAEGVMRRMEMEPDAGVWKTILSGCRGRGGRVELAEAAAAKVVELEPEGAAGYVMMSNVYCEAGRYGEGAGVRRRMKERGVVKGAGNSWVEVRGRVHWFMADGVGSEEDKGREGEIYRKVEEMMGRIKESGYVAQLKFELHDLDEEGKVVGLSRHSERLAVAFGLLDCPPGSTIRVFKNLRVCGDCHNAIKFVSKEFGRHIVLRDWNCFHHFRDGACSCGDFW